MTPSDPLGWILDGWKERLLAAEAARKTAGAIDRTQAPNTRALADLAVDDAQTELYRFKEDAMRGLMMVLRWLSESYLYPDWLANLFRDAAHDAVEPMTDHLRSRVLTLEAEVADLKRKVSELLTQGV